VPVFVRGDPDYFPEGYFTDLEAAVWGLHRADLKAKREKSNGKR